jgi:hypothetical protein
MDVRAQKKKEGKRKKGNRKGMLPRASNLN